MRVKLKRDWFGPRSVMYPRGTRTMPDDIGILPKDAVIVEGPVIEEPPVEPDDLDDEPAEKKPEKKFGSKVSE